MEIDVSFDFDGQATRMADPNWLDFGPRAAIGKALTRATRQAAEGLKDDVNHTLGATMRGRANNLMSASHYPNDVRINSLSPRSYVDPRGDDDTGVPAQILRSVSAAQTITANKRQWLAIPVGPVPVRTAQYSRVTPAQWPRNLPPLEFAPDRKMDRAFLIGRLAYKGPNAQRQVMYLLVRRVRTKKRIDLPSLSDKWSAEMGRLFGVHFEAEYQRWRQWYGTRIGDMMFPGVDGERRPWRYVRGGRLRDGSHFAHWEPTAVANARMRIGSRAWMRRGLASSSGGTSLARGRRRK